MSSLAYSSPIVKVQSISRSFPAANSIVEQLTPRVCMASVSNLVLKLLGSWQFSVKLKQSKMTMTLVHRRNILTVAGLLVYVDLGS